MIRRHFFRKRFEHMVRTDPRARRRIRDAEHAHEKEKDAHPWLHPFHFGDKYIHKHADGHHADGHLSSGIPRSHSDTGSPAFSRSGTPSNVNKPKKRKRDKLRPDMIRRVDAPVKVNQMNVGGFLSENSGPHRRYSIDSEHRVEAYTVDPEDGTGNNGVALEESNVLEKTASRTDSPTQMTPLSTPRIHEKPPSPRGNRRVSLAELPNLRHGREVSDNIPMSTIAEAASRPASIASSVFEESSSDEDSSPNGNAALQSTASLGNARSRRMSDPAHLPSHTTNPHLKKEFKRVRTMDPPKLAGMVSPPTVASTFPRTQTIEIREPAHPDRPRGYSSALPHVGTHMQPDMMRRRAATGSTFGAPLSRSESYLYTECFFNLLANKV